MKTVIGFFCAAVIGLVMSERALSSSPQTVAVEPTVALGESSRLVARFLASGTPALASYRARRRLSASTRGAA